MRLRMGCNRIELNDAPTLAFYLWNLGFWRRVHYRNRIFLMLDSADDSIGFTGLGEVINILRSNVIGFDLIAL